MAKGQSGRRQIVPESSTALDLMKYEIASEMGLPVGKNMGFNPNMEFATELGSIPSSSVNEKYWGHISARDAGAVGGTITRRLVSKGEQTQLGL